MVYLKIILMPLDQRLQLVKASGCSWCEAIYENRGPVLKRDASKTRLLDIEELRLKYGK